MFLKKVPKQYTYTISSGMNMSLPPPCFSVLKMYIQRLNYQVFPMKTSEAFQIWTKCVCLFVVLRPKSTAMVTAGRSVHLAVLFPEQA